MGLACWCGWSAAQLQIVEAAFEGVSRSGEGMLMPHLYTSGSDASSRRGLRGQKACIEGSSIENELWFCILQSSEGDCAQ